MKPAPIRLYFIPWAIYNKFHLSFRTEGQHRLTPLQLAVWSDFVVSGDDRFLVKSRTGDSLNKSLSKGQLALLIRGFDGLVIVK